MRHQILFHDIDLKTNSQRVKFVVCMIPIILAFSIANLGGYMILIYQLYEAMKAGKISKVVSLEIVRKFRKKGIIIEIQPERSRKWSRMKLNRV